MRAPLYTCVYCMHVYISIYKVTRNSAALFRAWIIDEPPVKYERRGVVINGPQVVRERARVDARADKWRGLGARTLPPLYGPSLSLSLPPSHSHPLPLFLAKLFFSRAYCVYAHVMAPYVFRRSRFFLQRAGRRSAHNGCNNSRGNESRSINVTKRKKGRGRGREESRVEVYGREGEGEGK